MDENVKEVRTHRVGSITLGSALVLFGILFLVHLFVPVLTYEIIFHIWPCIFILLGIEILLANRKKRVWRLWAWRKVCPLPFGWKYRVKNR